MSLDKFHVNARIQGQNEALTRSRYLPSGTWHFAAFDLLHKINSSEFVVGCVLQPVVCATTWSGCCGYHSGLSRLCHYDSSSRQGLMKRWFLLILWSCLHEQNRIVMFTVIASPSEVLSKLCNFTPIFLHPDRPGKNRAPLFHNRVGSANASNASDNGICWLVKIKANNLTLIKGVPFAVLRDTKKSCFD